ncbi:hypothetical protein [Kitasatospora purpeofusca]|uniref:hypothetical protein n=1 Tax=Kitasatospora purpeofusca TaxID=67352 RepID=UPI00386CC261
MTSLLQPPLITRLLAAERILIAGAGGGFDVYAGLPLALALRDAGKEVHLANLSFSELHALPAEVWQEPELALITPDTPSPEGYFPERTLARWLRLHGMPDQVWAFPRTGVRPLRAAYRSLVARLGIDAHHGVNHSLVLENLAAIDRAGGYLGAFSVPRDSREGTLYLDAVEHARAVFPEHPSIVQGSVAAALRGLFGDVRFTDRTKGGKLFVNPLMTLYFGVTVEALVAEHRYLDRLEGTVLMRQVATVISDFQDSLPVRRSPRQFPH